MEFIPMRVFEHKDVSIPQTEKSKSSANVVSSVPMLSGFATE